MKNQGITVIIPTYNCKDLLARTLDSICTQSLDRTLFEVIVVDDGSSDGTDLLVSKYKSRLDVSYFFQSDEGFRVAAARNIGIRHAYFDTVLFLDAGIVISSQLLALHMQYQTREDALVLIGTSYGVNDYSNKCEDTLRQVMNDEVDVALHKLGAVEETFDSRTSYLREIDFDLARMAAPWLIFWGGHVSVPTQSLRHVGGFDEWFNRWGGEDNELGLRLYQLGCTFRVLRQVASIHLPHEKDPVQKRFDARINTKYIHQKHGLIETSLLIDHNWKCIVSGNYAFADGGSCGCMSSGD
ncbi:glycosyltransferase [Dyella tabacisoli]|uniref:Glycosyltransferase n=1 Tax=Dyella tabacisoli TaxID=2282381 RepID=A0A369UIP9_9GAMM|nr:glycosyltransferase [Dyella tabacisoli]RDD80431.1 glycosyltransferase [Dyella tabacisoli]